MKPALLRTLRVFALVLVSALGTVALMRFAPGYFTDGHEVDPQFSEAARERLQMQQETQGSIVTLTRGIVQGWMHGDLGQSKQYEVPVRELMSPRIRVSARLLLLGVSGGWLVALLFALPLGARRGATGEAAVTGLTVLLLTIPLGALATACLLANVGGPIAVLIAIVAIRDFKLVYRLIRQARLAPHLVYARAQGLAWHRRLLVHLMRPLTREFLAIAVVSGITALSTIVPVEVIFDVPGLGQLAWSAAMNRDLPVLLGVTLLMAAVVGCLTAASQSRNIEASL